MMVQMDGLEANNGEIFCAYDPEDEVCETELVDELNDRLFTLTNSMEL
jgi:hypothetical protein